MIKVGDIVKCKYSPSWPHAKVTEITERGFKYEYLTPFHAHPRLGLTFLGGETYAPDSYEVVKDE